MKRSVILVALFATSGWLGAQVRCFAEDEARGSVVKLHATLRLPDPIRPWAKQAPREVAGSGAVIAGKRILTNAHIVVYASEVSVQPNQSSEKLPAKVVAVAPGIDLAILSLEDESFFENHKALSMATKLPLAQDSVSVYGYPQGGTDLSITKGIVSRIEFEPYNQMMQGLRIQVDAAINPGNSGGPALVGDAMIGLAFSRLGGADNIGYIIPTEEINLFLQDITDGKYDGKPALLDEFQTLENDAIRAQLKLEKSAPGIMITRPGGTEASGYPLREGDIITKIGATSIDNTGKARIEGDRLIAFQYLVQKLARDGKVSLEVLRDGKTAAVEVPVGPERDQWLCSYLKGRYPSYYIFGPMVFSEATDEFIGMLMQAANVARFLSFMGNPLITRYGQRPAFPGERLVVVSHPLLTHRIGKGYSNSFMRVVDQVNGVKIKNLPHFVEVIRDSKDEFIEFRFAGVRSLETIVFRRAEALAATEDILSDNGIRQAYSEDIAPVWRKQP